LQVLASRLRPKDQVIDLEFEAAIALVAAQLLLPVFATIALYQSTYSINVLSDEKFAIQRAILALLVSSALLIFVTFYTKSTTSFSRATFTMGLLFTVAGIVAFRLILIRLVRYLQNMDRVIVRCRDRSGNFLSL
jgi:FlaA1/EpsC-like NDP-sugar epimerase